MKSKKKYCQPEFCVSLLQKQCALDASVQSGDPFTTDKTFDEWW